MPQRENGQDKIFKELRQVRNLLILSLLKNGATSDEVNYATGMGSSNIRRMFPVKRTRKKSILVKDQEGTNE